MEQDKIDQLKAQNRRLVGALETIDRINPLDVIARQTLSTSDVSLYHKEQAVIDAAIEYLPNIGNRGELYQAVANLQQARKERE